MIIDDLKEKLSNNKNDIFFDTVYTPKFNKRYSKLLPDFEHAFIISKARNVKKCLNICINDVDYYIIEANVLYRKNIVIEKIKKNTFFGLFQRIKTSSNEKDVIALFENAKQKMQKQHKNIIYKKYYDHNTNAVFYFFTMRTYFLATNEKIEEVNYLDLNLLRNTFKQRTFIEKQDLFNKKLDAFFKTNFKTCI